MQRNRGEKTRSGYASCETAETAFEKEKEGPIQGSRVRAERTRASREARNAPDPQRIKRLASIAAASVAVALVAVVYGAWTTFSAQKIVETATADTRPILVAERDIRAGEVFDAASLVIRHVPQSMRVRGALGAEVLESAESPVGKQALVDTPQGSQIAPVMVAGSGEGGSLSTSLEADKQAVTIAVDVESGLAGQLRPSDRVRVVALGDAASGEVYLETVCENVRVISLDADRFGSSGAYASATVEVDAAQAEAIRAAQFGGRVSLILLSSLDDSTRNNLDSTEEQPSPSPESAQEETSGGDQ